MTYLPEEFTHDTVFPRAFGKDAHLQIRLVEEKWRRFYPEINYYCLDKNVTVAPAESGGLAQATGTTGGTAFDPITGESVDPAALTSAWKQPHLSGDRRAVGTERFLEPIKLHAQVRREAKEKELKKLGFDEVRDLLLTIPASMLDKLAITVQQGDRFIWDNDLFEVTQFEATGYWKNTNIRLYLVLNCRHWHPGS